MSRAPHALCIAPDSSGTVAMFVGLPDMGVQVSQRERLNSPAKAQWDRNLDQKHQGYDWLRLTEVTVTIVPGFPVSTRRIPQSHN